MQDGGPQGELELGDYLAILRRRWIWFVVPLVLVPILAFVYSSQQELQYEATAEVLLGETAAQEAVGGSNQNTQYLSRLMENELSLALSDAAFEGAAERFGVDVEDVPEATITADDASDVLIFTATSTSPQTAADTANAWAETYVELKRSQAQDSIDSAVTQLETRLANLQTARDDVRADLTQLEDTLVLASEENRAQIQLRVDREESRISGPVALIDAQIDAVVDSINELELSGELALSGSARVVSVANVPVESTNPPASRNVVLGLVVGAILGAALALLVENLDRAIRTEEDIERAGLLHLGSVPKTAKSLTDHALATVEDPSGPEAEAAQKIQTAMQFITASQGVRSIVVTSARQGDGKTTTACNLAIAMARAGKRTLLIDSDLRRPRIHKVFGVPQSPGMTNIALGDNEVTDAARMTSISDSLVILPAGSLPPHAASFISLPVYGDTIDELETLADFTIIDAAPILPVADTLSLVSHLDSVVIVVHAGKTTRDELAETVDSLENAGGRVLGCVLVGVKTERKAYEYRYDSEDSGLERMSADDRNAPVGLNHRNGSTPEPADLPAPSTS